MLYLSILGVSCLHLVKQTGQFETVRGNCRTDGETLVKQTTKSLINLLPLEDFILYDKFMTFLNIIDYLFDSHGKDAVFYWHCQLVTICVTGTLSGVFYIDNFVSCVDTIFKAIKHF